MLPILLALSSFGLTYLIMRLALKKNIVSIPNSRSLHNVPTPLGGGLAIVISWYAGITFMFFSDLVDRQLYFALMSGIILTVISFLDDLINIRPFIRLIFHFATAIIAFSILGGLRQFIIPGIEFDYRFLTYPLAVVGIVWFLNLFNFMDGVDGFASTESVLVCLVMFFLTGNIINVILIACVAGFLFWNWPKAKIFMGDVGSIQLGFILVVLGIYSHNTYQFSILNWIMITSPFWFDATLTLLRRWFNKENLGEAHKKHAYQRFIQSGFTHLQLNVVLIIINLFVFFTILVYREFKGLQIPLFFLNLCLFYFLTWQVDKRVPFK